MTKDEGAEENRDENLSFEEALSILEDIVEQLETGDLPLENSLQLFERGVRLTRRCKHLLDSAQHQIDQLTEEGDLVPFEE
jgi:exodeoxyribonuclease VII small subunit